MGRKSPERDDFTFIATNVATHFMHLLLYNVIFIAMSMQSCSFNNSLLHDSLGHGLLNMLLGCCRACLSSSRLFLALVTLMLSDNSSLGGPHGLFVGFMSHDASVVQECNLLSSEKDSRVCERRMCKSQSTTATRRDRHTRRNAVTRTRYENVPAW